MRMAVATIIPDHWTELTVDERLVLGEVVDDGLPWSHNPNSDDIAIDVDRDVELFSHLPGHRRVLTPVFQSDRQIIESMSFPSIAFASSAVGT